MGGTVNLLADGTLNYVAGRCRKSLAQPKWLTLSSMTDDLEVNGLNEKEILVTIYRHFHSQLQAGEIPVTMRPPSLMGTVQDDPFDCWIAEEIEKAAPHLQVYQAGKLTTQDVIIRAPATKSIVSLEVKKLMQLESGANARGLTLDYNSCLPCGTTLIKVRKETMSIPCYYFFALLNQSSTGMVSLILMDGDFLNYDFKLHKEAKLANTSEYNHGPYREGSVRHRRMYTYPNPLNSKLPCFHLRHTLVCKKHDAEMLDLEDSQTDIIVRDDIYNNSFHYSVIDLGQTDKAGTTDHPPIFVPV